MALSEPLSDGDRTDLTPSLVARLRAGEADAGWLLDEMYRKPLLRFCWGYLGNQEDAEDAVQEVFCKVLGTTDVPDSFRAWVYKIARNQCLNVLRARVRRQDAQPMPVESQLGVDQTGYLTRLVEREQQSRVRHLLGALPAGQREALRLRYVEKLSRKEIAYILDVPESAVKSRLFDGIKNLREHSSLVSDH